MAAGKVCQKCLKLIKPHLITFKTRGCLGKTIITYIINTEYIAYTASACDIVKHKSFPQIATMV